MAAVVQSDGASGTDWPKIMIITVVAGNSIVVVMEQDTHTALAAFSVADNRNGSYGAADKSSAGASSRSQAIFHIHKVIAGVTTITMQGENGTNGQGIAFEVSGLSNERAVATGSQDIASNTVHASSSVALTGKGIAVCAINESADVAHTEGVGYTKRDGVALRNWAQYKAGSLAADSGAFTTGSNVDSHSVMAIFADALPVTPRSGPRSRKARAGHQVSSPGSYF